jgi:hypothetical protein
MATASGVRVWGNVPLTQNTKVKAGVNDSIVVKLNGVDYPITIDERDYQSSHTHVTSELVQHITGKLSAAGCPVLAKVGGIHDDNPRTVLVIEAIDTSNTVTMEVSGNGSTAFIGDKPYQVQPPNSGVYTPPQIAFTVLNSSTNVRRP